MKKIERRNESMYMYNTSLSLPHSPSVFRISQIICRFQKEVHIDIDLNDGDDDNDGEMGEKRNMMQEPSRTSNSN